jgi:hypothetical protein
MTTYRRTLMRCALTAAIVVGMLVVPTVGFTATPAPPAQTAAKHPSSSNVASHATTGVVKSMDAGTLVITRSGKPGGEMTFIMSPSTHKEGAVAVGSTVSVRYREDGKTYVATAITAKPTKQQAAHK